MENQLRIAVIGCGSIAKNRHLPEHHNNPHVEIVAVCDHREERVQETASLYQVKAYTDYEKLLAVEELDAVSICLPNYLHSPVSVAALNAGCHVLCEKPMATSREEADQMIEAANKKKKKLMIGHNQRFVSSHQRAKELIDRGEAGKIYSFRTTFGHGGPESWSADGARSWFFKKDKAFIGAMGDLGVHKADLMRYLLNEEFINVTGFIETSAKPNTDVDDNAVLILRSESGIIGTLAASWAYTAQEDNSTVIYGDNATLRMEDDPEFSLVVQYKNDEVVNYELDGIQSNKQGGQTTTHVIDHFVESILDDKEPIINGEEGKKSLEVILNAMESSKVEG
ncbi:Gfo/Idh/MocA family protein [Lentibacillus salinarum]|uniref:Gfo/Idh/MocA family protein n=1 Tax=Lentibacillus salinarum TaxID=446820 RepID=A0ABW3ZV05_9BACI